MQSKEEVQLIFLEFEMRREKFQESIRNFAIIHK